MVLGAYQLQLPGLHYDEAKEAGLNAMELITGQPVTAFRGTTVQVGPLRLPLMVQDYIGALNVVLAAAVPGHRRHQRGCPALAVSAHRRARPWS